jgi:hypothetical protein
MMLPAISGTAAKWFHWSIRLVCSSEDKQYSNIYHSPNFAYTMGGHDGLPKQTGNAELMPAPKFSHLGRPSMVITEYPSLVLGC